MATNTKSPDVSLPLEDKLTILRQGAVELQGLFRLGSNDTFLCSLESPLGALRAVYKPARGERPLWDFPTGTLGKREAAAFEVARAIGWDFVPPTVFRDEGPLGPGSFQEYLPLNLEENYFLLRGREPEILHRVAAFDIVINNADRKAMHIVRDSHGRIWLIDHGVCFHVDWKVRTVVWEFAGEDLPQDVLSALDRFLESAAKYHPNLKRLLRTEEISALETRTAGLLSAKKFPEPGPGISIPWPILA
jgi:hypothetical protein